MGLTDRMGVRTGEEHHVFFQARTPGPPNRFSHMHSIAVPIRDRIDALLGCHLNNLMLIRWEQGQTAGHHFDGSVERQHVIADVNMGEDAVFWLDRRISIPFPRRTLITIRRPQIQMWTHGTDPAINQRYCAVFIEVDK